MLYACSTTWSVPGLWKTTPSRVPWRWFFWVEPIPTCDLDVLVFLPGNGATIVSLAPLDEWATQHGCFAQAEHAMIKGVPVRFLPAHDRAASAEYEGVPVRVVRPEHLVALCLEPGAQMLKRRERAAARMESSALDRAVLDELLKRFGLETWRMAQPPQKRPQPSPELPDALRVGKAALRRQREQADLSEKIRIVFELQRLCLPRIARERQLAEWERPWAVTP
jgi:hypothetical protein